MKKNWKKRVSGRGRRGSGWCFMISMEILQDCVIALGNSKFKNHDAGNSTSFLIDPQNFYMLFLQYHWKFHVFSHPTPPLFYLHFIWNRPCTISLLKLCIFQSSNDTWCPIGLRHPTNSKFIREEGLNYFDKFMLLLIQNRIFEISSMS